MYLLGSDGGTFDLPPGRTGIGRARDNEMVVLLPLVSRWHAAIYFDGARCSAVDLGSTHGTMLNGVRLQPQQPYPLRPGDVLVLAGQISFALREGAPKGISTGIPTGPRAQRSARRLDPFVVALFIVALVLLAALALLAVFYIQQGL